MGAISRHRVCVSLAETRPIPHFFPTTLQNLFGSYQNISAEGRAPRHSYSSAKFKRQYEGMVGLPPQAYSYICPAQRPATKEVDTLLNVVTGKRGCYRRMH
jgi:hypothetical protein